MTNEEREELIEKMGKAFVNSLMFDDGIRAALAVAEPVIREQAENALREELAAMERRARIFEAANEKMLADNKRLREENARLREELQKGFTAMRVFAKYRELEAEIETLRKAVKAAYYEGWQDNASIEDTEDRLHAEWACSEACAAIREGDKNG